jgi:hypothetical protein
MQKFKNLHGPIIFILFAWRKPYTPIVCFIGKIKPNKRKITEHQNAVKDARKLLLSLELFFVYGKEVGS